MPHESTVRPEEPLNDLNIDHRIKRESNPAYSEITVKNSQIVAKTDSFLPAFKNKA